MMSLVRSGLRGSLGSFVLLAWVAAPHAQQLRGSTSPGEQLVLRPARTGWSELLQLQASLPRSLAVEAQPQLPLGEVFQPGDEFVVRGAASVAELRGQGGGRERSLASCPGSLVEPLLERSFASQLDVPDGAGFSFIPPNTTGSVGPDHLMVMLNNKVLVQDRHGGAAASVDTSVFWSPLGANPVSPTNTFHRLHFDAVDGRWIASARNGAAATATVFFAISEGDDPTGIWDYYSFAADGTGTTFPDWLVSGYNSRWITLNADMFTVAAGTFVGSKMWAIDKATALAGGPITITTFPTAYPSPVSGVGGATGVARWMPSRALDASDPDMYLLHIGQFSNGAGGTPPNTALIQMLRITGTGPAPTVVPSGTSSFAPAATSSLFQVAPTTTFSNTQRTMAQLADARTISPFSTRMASVVVRNGRVWAVHTGGLPGPINNAAPTSTGVLWYQLDPAAMPAPIVQSGAITAGANTASIIPSIAVNCGDDAVIGFSNGDATRFARAAYAVHLGTGALGSMGPIRELKAGESSYFKIFSGTTNLWGNYSSATVDPVDDRTLWTLQEYAGLRVGPADNDSRWGTWWGRLGSCGTPFLADQPDSVVVCDGAPASFSVAAIESAPPLSYQWRKNGADLPGETGTTLSIAAAGAADEASYDVVVDDGCGQQVSLPATLALATAPLVLMDPASATRCTEETAVFTVSASSNAPLTYQWRKDGIDLPGENGSTLTLNALVLGDAGDYDVVIDNGCDTTTSAAATLMVEEKQTILDQPDGVVACLGDSALFSVSATASFPLTYQWRKNGVDLPGEESDTLVLTGLTAADAASYDVRVGGDCDPVFSTPAVLSFDAASFLLQPAPQTVCEGSLVILEVVSSDPTVTYQWRHDGVPITPGHISPVNRPYLAFLAATGDAGLYDCVIDNGCAPPQASLPALLTVAVGPAITADPLGLRVSPSQPASFSVTATGSAPLAYQWRRNGLALPGENGPTLQFASVAATDAASYDVVVSNACGSVTSAAARLEVNKLAPRTR